MPSRLFAGPIDAGRVRLRAAALDDAAAVAALMTPGISQWLASWPEEITETAARDRIATWHAAMTDGRALQWVVERRLDRALMGWISVSRAATDPGRGAMGFWIGEAYKGRGYMREAVAAALGAAFTALDLHVIEAGAQMENAASFALMRSVGMTAAGQRMEWGTIRKREELCEFYEITRNVFLTRHSDATSKQ